MLDGNNSFADSDSLALVHINLRGLAIGNALYDDEEQFKWYAPMVRQFEESYGIEIGKCPRLCVSSLLAHCSNSSSTLTRIIENFSNRCRVHEDEEGGADLCRGCDAVQRRPRESAGVSESLHVSGADVLGSIAGEGYLPLQSDGGREFIKRPPLTSLLIAF